MKKSRIPLILSLFALCACQGNNISEDTKPSENMPTETAKPTETAAPNTYRPNIYEQLTYALEDLNNSMTLTGKLSYATSDGTKTSTSESEVTAEIDQDAYYYREADQITNETLVEENFFAGEDGFMYARTLDPLTNEVIETKSSNKYDIAMESPLPELEVKCLDAVREKPNWFIIKSKYHSLASRIVYFLTGYQTTGLPISLAETLIADLMITHLPSVNSHFISTEMKSTSSVSSSNLKSAKMMEPTSMRACSSNWISPNLA